MEPIWIVFLEVLAFIDSAPTEGKLGYINVVAAAADADAAQAKVAKVLEEYGWEIIVIEDTSTADPDSDYRDDLCELIDDVAANPHHVRLSTLHSYKAN